MSNADPGVRNFRLGQIAKKNLCPLRNSYAGCAVVNGYRRKGVDPEVSTHIGGRYANMPRGEKHYHAKLTESQVREIRRRYAVGGILMRDLAKEYGVRTENIRFIVRRKTWRHVTDE